LNGVADQNDALMDVAALDQTSARVSEREGFGCDRRAARDARCDLAEAGHLVFFDCRFSVDVEVSADHLGVIAALVEPFDGPRAHRSPASLRVPVVYEVQSDP
jgi:hypothetical protein